MKAPTRPYGLGTPSEALCLMKQIDSSQQLLEAHYTQDEMLEANWFDMRGKGFPLALFHYPVEAGSIFYFARSRFAGWYYILRWDEKAQRYGCTCKESASQGHCQHQTWIEDRHQLVA